ncbi:MAG: hypothetical protein GY768_06380 [Planctomycetaceae bacterium]|nr:hypothetical protein [Planctomycetaceae bacterium]
MGIKRVFLDWRRPALPAAVNYLADRIDGDGCWDLSSIVIVLPGARAGRRLREVFVAEAESRGCVFFPPQITTVGQLPELLYVRKKPFATDLVQKLAWASALKNATRENLSRFLNDIPQASDDPRWLETGALLWNLHRELASDALDFKHVVESMSEAAGDREKQRWQSLAQLQQHYLTIVDGLGLWDRQTARLFAIEHQECQTAGEIFLLATADMNRATRLMLDQVSDHVSALVHADPNQAQRFDSHGCLVPNAWQDFQIPLHESQVLQVESPVDQGRAVVDRLVRLKGRFAAAEVTVGVPDEKMVPLIQQQLQHAGLAARWGPGRSIECAPPLRLLRILIDYLQKPSFVCFSELVRHPDVEHWLVACCQISGDLMMRLDDYQNQYLPLRSPDLWHETKEIADVIQAVEGLLIELKTAPQLPTAWSRPVLDVLRKLYDDCTFDPDQEQDRMVLAGCEAIRDAMLQLEHIPAALAIEVSCDQALLMAVDSMEASQLPAPIDRKAIEMLGWLELPLDDAPVLMVTGMNEGNVPTSSNGDLFLPNSLRAELGLNDNLRRYARDAYALTVLSHSRSELCLILGRRDWQGDPLSPSRLLFATDTDTIVSRALRFFAEVEQDLDLIAVSPNRVEREHHQFFVPVPNSSSPVESVRVTDFRAYLACPYRFYLERILKLRSSVDGLRELDGAAFGKVLHEVLDRFGSGAKKDSQSKDVIAEDLMQQLAAVSAEMFGSHPSTAVQVQMVQMRQRLEAFAERQAEWRAQGWQICMTEDDVQTTWGPLGDGIQLRGRIDRIDQNERTGEWVVLDYKSGDQGDTPRKTHLGKKKGVAVIVEDWIDLQLPLYRHLAPSLGYEGPFQLGYVSLPREIGKTSFQLADWNSAELALADQAAVKVVQQIRAGVFWPPSVPPPAFSEPFSAICQDQVFDRQLGKAAFMGEQS